jgi:hypothetical protein
MVERGRKRLRSAGKTFPLCNQKRNKFLKICVFKNCPKFIFYSEFQISGIKVRILRFCVRTSAMRAVPGKLKFEL